MMKKVKRTRTARFFTKAFNFRAWLNYDNVKEMVLSFFDIVSKLFIPETPKKVESFEKAIQRLSLSEEAIEQQKRGFYRLSILMSVITFLLLSYTAFHIYYLNYNAIILSFVVMLIALSLAFRYHFWYFQLKKRKLGCTFKEWLNEGLLGVKK